jgi:hypothetical protein
VIIGNKKKAPVLVLHFQEILHRPEVISEVQVTR